MKELLIDKKYSNSFLQFINDEVINCAKELEGVIVSNDDFIQEEEISLYECFNSLSKNFSIEYIESKFSLWFPYGILLSANDFNYDTVKKYIDYISLKYHYDEKDLFYNPEIFFKNDYPKNIEEKISLVFEKFKNKNNFLENIINKLKNKNSVEIIINQNKFLKTKLILNITESSKDLIEFLFDNEIFHSNTKIIYGEKSMFLLEYWLCRSLTSASALIKKMILNINMETALKIQSNIENINISYLDNFREEKDNFNNNIQLLNKKILLLKLEEQDSSSSSSSSGSIKSSVVKI